MAELEEKFIPLSESLKKKLLEVQRAFQPPDRGYCPDCEPLPRCPCCGRRLSRRHEIYY